MQATQVPVTTTPLDAGTSARLLRRLDWRFLLPDPQLRRVGYVGPGRTLLVRALQAYAERLSFPLLEQTGPDQPCDLLVVESAGGAHVASASRRLVAGGWVYWELGPLDAWRFRHPRAIAAHGLSPVATHWHYRGFDDSRWVVQIDEPRNVAAMLERKLEGFPQMISSLSRMIARSQTIRRLLPTSVIAHRGDL